MEYLYIHLQKRAMNFTPGIEDEDSFMIIPNEFVKDHELTQEEIVALMTPDPEYKQAKISYAKPTIIRRIMRFIFKSRHEKIFYVKVLINKLLGRKLPSMWASRGVKDTYGVAYE